MPVQVAPGNPRSTHDIRLSDGVVEYGLSLVGGPKGIQEIPQTPSTLLVNKQGSRYSNNDPSFSHLEQIDWTGGRGQDNFTDDPSKFFDSQAAWTLTPNRILNAPQWRLATGMTQKNISLPGSVQWRALTGNYKSLAISFADNGGTTAEQVYMWIRRRGKPGGLVFELCNDNAGVPGSVRVTASVTTATITDTISVFQAFDWVGTNTLSNGVTYWMKISGAAGDNAANHWQVGCDASASGQASAGGAWTPTTGAPWYWLSNISSANVAINAYYRQDWRIFFLEGAHYAVSVYRPPYAVTGATVSTLYINGDRGTVSSSASQLTVTDNTKAWTTNQWAGAKVRVIDGPGDGEWRTIVSNTGTALTVDIAFIITQTTATRYVIYDTPTWTLIGSNPANFVVSSVCVANRIAYFSCRTVRAFVQFRSNPTTSAHEFNTTETQQAGLLAIFNSPDDGLQLWRAGVNSLAVGHAAIGAEGYCGIGDSGYAIDNTADKTKLNTAALPLKAWAVNQWTGCLVTITDGPGQGETRTVASNTATVITVTSVFTVTHTVETQYTVSAIKTNLIASPNPNWVVNQWAGCTVTIIGGPGVSESKTIVSNTANTLTVTAWTAQLTIQSQYAINDWGALHQFSAGIPVGDTSYNITNMLAYNNEFYVFKEDSIWRVVNDRAQQLPVGLEAMPESTNGAAAIAQNLFLFFSWSHSVERLYGGTLDDFGPWKGRGMPAGRQGPISAMESVFNWLFVAVDGGPSGTSCVMVWNGFGWHEIFRAWGTGWRIRALKWLPCPGGRPKLYISIGPLLVFMHMPLDTLNPQNDSTFPYQHESVLVTSTYDMGTARLPKFFKELEAFTETLNRTSATEKGRLVVVDYQVDDAIGGTTWTRAGFLDNSPYDSVQLMRGNVRSIRFRLRLIIAHNTNPLPVRATILEGFARTPVKYQYNVKVQTSSLKRTSTGQLDVDPDEFVGWLKLMAGSAGKVRVNSVYKQWNDKFVIVEPPTILRNFVNKILGLWGGELVFTIRDA